VAHRVYRHRPALLRRLLVDECGAGRAGPVGMPRPRRHHIQRSRAPEHLQDVRCQLRSLQEGATTLSTPDNASHKFDQRVLAGDDRRCCERQLLCRTLMSPGGTAPAGWRLLPPPSQPPAAPPRCSAPPPAPALCRGCSPCSEIPLVPWVTSPELTADGCWQRWNACWAEQSCCRVVNLAAGWCARGRGGEGDAAAGELALPPGLHRHALPVPPQHNLQ
jgi:hypothetical protein